ncbi:MAG: hypothetical protein BGO90_10905 [Legionella sp. 40-6]|nr:FecR domain-containing protein [Legionella sp.]OJX95545.1 MAG: hypothetical protein BGO90_10905 [Legionella sp. 40-6]
MRKWLFLFLVAYQLNAFADAAGKVLFTSKDVLAERNNQQRNLSRGSPFFEGDTIITRAGALAQLQYSNGTLVSLQPNSSYKVVSYNKSAKSENSAYLGRGGLDSTTNEKKKSQLSTPLVALAISGTQYRTGIFCNTEKCKKIAVQVTQGKVIIDNKYPLGPGELQSSAIYNAITKQITYGPIDWAANGWVSFPSNLTNGSDFIDPSTLTSVINSTTINNAANAIVNSIAAPTTTICLCCQ